MKLSTLITIAILTFFGMKATQSLGKALQNMQKAQQERIDHALAQVE